MTSKYPISKLERRLLLAFAFLLFAVFATEAFCDAVQSYNRSVYIQQQELARAAGATVISFSGNGPQTTPLFHLVSLFIFLTIWRQRYFGAAILSTSYLFVILLALYIRYNSFNPEYIQRAPLSELLPIVTNPTDLFAFVFIVFFGTWYASLLVRFGWNANSPTLP